MGSLEIERLSALNEYQVVDTASEAVYDNLAMLAAEICQTPIALVSLITEDRQWVKAKVGLDIYETAREHAFCSYTIQDDILFEMANTHEDDRFQDNPLVRGEPGIRFYAGQPLVTPSGHHIGSLCVMDTKPRILTDQQRMALKVLAEGVMSNLEIAKKNKQLETMLAEARRFEGLFNSSNEIHCITNAEGTIEFINDSVEHLLGFSGAEVLGKNIWEFSIPGERDRVMPAIVAELASGKNYFNIETRVRTKDGRLRWFEWADVMKDGKWLVNGRDITFRKDSETQLRTLSLAVEKAAAGVVIRSVNGQVEWMNRAAEEIFGYSFDELKGLELENTLVGDGADLQELQSAHQAVEQHKPYELEFLIYKKDRTPAWVYISNNPLFNELGEVEHQIGVVVDITERKLTEKQLIKTREDAINLSKAKESFLSVMSHEMRTPLNAVIGMARVLKEEDPLDRQIKNLNILEFSAGNLLTLINDVLDFTKIETGNLQLEKIAFNLPDLVSKTIDSLQFKMEGKNVKLLADVDAALPQTILGDTTRLYQIFMNLVGNSVKFTEKGEVKLSLKREEESADKVKIRFEVSDTGIGIPASKLDTIFDAYTQAGDDVARKFGGTGLGLTITQKLIKLHGADIKVESEVGKGTKFYFSIWYPKAAGKPSAQSEQEQLPLNARALVVDDNAVNRLLAKKVLQKWAVETDFAENGLDAINKVKENHYDLVLMDINMPVMGGLEATRFIRNSPDQRVANMPIIALTASVPKSDENRFLQAGMNGFVLKPFEPSLFYAALKSVLDVNVAEKS